MEGILHVPPDRGTIIGRAIWKPRYVVVAAPADAKHRVQQQRQQSNASSTPSLPSTTSTGTNSHASTVTANPPRITTPASPSSLSAENMYLSVFKSKGDWEPVQQHAISSITDCQVQMLAHRKQGPILPTLVINISPDPITDKLRKRRSSRTAGLTSTKDSSPTTLWFRPAEDNHHKQALLEWCRFIQALMLQLGTVMSSASGPLSPITPASPTFVNPFSAPKERAAAQAAQPSQSHTNQLPASRDDRPKYTDSPSLRSRRSDLSHTSSNLPPHVATSGYSTTSSGSHYNTPFFQNQQRPTDLPSPATTVNESQLQSLAQPQSEFAEGFTAAQSRSSAINAMNSPSRGRESVSSPVMPASATTGALPSSTLMNSSSSPPVPRETILDRAFQMRFIPGSQRDTIPGEEKLSSLARFDALMREAEERKRLRQAVAVSDLREIKDPRSEIKRSVTTAPYVGRPSRSNSYNHQPQFHPQFPSQSKPMEAPKSGWDLDEDSDDVDGSGSSEDDDDDDEEDDEGGVHSGDDNPPEPALGRNGRRAESSGVCPKAITANSGIDIAPNALRALDFIAGRHHDEHASHAHRKKGGMDEFEASSITPKARGGILNYDAHTLKTLDSGPSYRGEEALRPQTGYASSRSRPSIAQRTHSQPQLAALNVNNYISTMTAAAGNRRSHKPSAHHHAAHAKSPISPMSPMSPPSMPPLPRSATTSRVSDTLASPLSPLSPSESSPTKHLSFNDFTKRLNSSTSSLLLVQSNASSGSSSGSVNGGAALDQQYTTAVSSTAPPARHVSGSSRMTSPHAPPPPPATSVERCGWRSSVNVVSTEGGFL